MNVNESGSKYVTNLLPHQDELLQLSEIAGVYISPGVFRIIVELLNMQINPEAIFKLLKKIRRSTQRSAHKSSTSAASEDSSNTAS